MEFLLNNLFLLKVAIAVISYIPYEIRTNKLLSEFGYKKVTSIKQDIISWFIICLMLMIPYLGWILTALCILRITACPSIEYIRKSSLYKKEI